MHMIDVMKKLQEIAEAGYDNEDIQRGIDAAGKAVNAASGDIIVGRAYEAGVTGQIIAIELVLAGNAHA